MLYSEERFGEEAHEESRRGFSIQQRGRGGEDADSVQRLGRAQSVKSLNS